jgi:4-hydroxy-2-oxoheptanedioate aldolase
MIRNNQVKERIKQGQTVFGVYSVIPSPELVELAGLCGFDYIRIDCHHGHANLETIANMIRAAEIFDLTPFARVYNDPQRILSVLDMGARGIIVPDIHDAADARAAVESTKFKPLGDRGLFTNSRSSDYGEFKGKEYLEWANDNVMLGLQIENSAALKNLEEILKVEGIDFVMGGRNDLSQSLGVAGQKDHPLVIEAENRIINCASKAGIMVSLSMNPHQANFEEQLKVLIKKGSNMITLGTDISFVQRIYKETLKKLKGAIAGC